MRRVVASLCLCLAVSVFAQNDGERLYERKCSTCHAADGRGETSVGKKLGVKDLRRALNSMTDEQIEDVVVNGRGQMPANKKLDEDQLGAITKYLHQLPTRDAASEKAHAVEKLYREKCAGCHARDGAGNVALGRTLKVPDLTSAVVQDQSEARWASVITNGKGRMPGFARSCTPAQVKDLIGYVKLLRAKNTAQATTATKQNEAETGERARRNQEEPGASQASHAPERTVSAPEASRPRAESEAAAPHISDKTDTKPKAEAKSAAPPKVARGKPTGIQQTYVAKCAACHSPDGSGQGTIGRSMKIPSFSSAEVQREDDEELAKVISSGRGKMPAYATKLTSEQIAQLVAYVRTLGRK
jgi:cytochrome c6